MDPILLQMLQGLMTNQGGAFGLPNAGTNNFMPQIFEEIKDFTSQQSNRAGRLNADPLTDIEPFRMNAFRGFLAQDGGAVSPNGVGEMSQFVMPTTNSLPGGSIMNAVRNNIMMTSLQGLVGSQPVQSFDKGGFVETLIVDDNEFTRQHLNRLEKYEHGGQVKPGLVYVPIQFQHGGPVHLYGVEKAFLGKLIKGIGKGIGSVAKGIGKGLGKVAGFASDVAGALAPIASFIPGINAFAPVLGAVGGLGDFIQGGAKGGIGGFLSSVGGGALSGIGGGGLGGTLAGLGSSLLGSLGGAGGGAGAAGSAGGVMPSLAGGAAGGFSPIQGSLFGRINQPTGGLFTQPNAGVGPFTGLQGPLSNLANILGQAQRTNQNTGIGGGLQTLPDTGQGVGVTPTTLPNKAGSFSGMLQFLGGSPGFAGGMFGIPQFQEGGPVGSGLELIPIQTEKVGNQPEMIIHIDGSITPVNATKRHRQMDDDEVTDFIPAGSYITSADKTMKLSYDDADQIVMGIEHMPYKERKQGKAPKEITLASLWARGDRKPKTYAELADRLSKKMKIVDRSDDLEYGNDIFTKSTNQDNMETRLPYISEIVRLNEEQRLKKDGSGAVGEFKHGGSVHMPGIQHANFGKFLEGALSLAPSVVPLVSSLFGGGQQPQGIQGAAGVSPLVQNGILATIPQSQIGINQNISAQSGALNQAVDDFSSLGNQLINNARQSSQIQNFANIGNVGLGLMNQFGQETDLGRLNFAADRARINNFQPRSGSLASVEALSTPNFDSQAIMQQLGSRSGPVIAQLLSNQQRTANQALINRNQQLDQFDLNKIQQLNQLSQIEQPFNVQQGDRETALRNQQRSGIFGTLQGGLQRGADIQSGLIGQIGGIQSQILPITTQFALQNAQLAGQNNILGAQNALNAFTTLGGLQSQNALAQLMQQQQAGGGNQLIGPQRLTGLLQQGLNQSDFLPVDQKAVFNANAQNNLPGIQPLGEIKPRATAQGVSPNATRGVCPPGTTYNPQTGLCE